MALLTAAEILAAQDRKFEKVEVPEWGGEVYVFECTGAQRDRLERVAVAQDDQPDNELSIRAILLAFSICDEKGNPIFTEEQIRDLSQKNYKVLDRIREVADRLSGLTDEDKRELEKNSKTQSDESSGR